MAARPSLAALDPDGFVLREAYGLGAPLEPALRLRLAMAVKAIACADRDLSEAESERLHALSRAYGLPRQEAEELRKWDALGAPVEPILDRDARPYARLILHDALRVARADGVSDRERKAAALAARALRLDPEVVLAVRGLLEVDEAVRGARHALIQGRWPQDDPIAIRGAVHEAEAYRRQEYGLVGPLDEARALRLARAVVALAAADGELSAPEWRWLAGWARAVGVEPDELAVLTEATPLADPGALLAAEPEPFARLALYAAVRVARADGVASAERAGAERAAAALRVHPTIVPALEGLLGMEDALRGARLRVLSSHSSDTVAPRGTF